MVLGLSLALLIIILDQLSKYYILEYVVNEYGVIPCTSFFNIVRAWNTGVSFSMFNDMGNMGIWVLSLSSIIIVCFLIYWLYKENNKLIQISLGFIIGGALGNVIDRIRLGAVFDFLDFYVGDKHWPAFNVADSFICIGAFLIIMHSLFNQQKEKEEKK